MKSRRGFSTIEMIVCVAIIGIIVAIAVPNLVEALSRANIKRHLGLTALPTSSFEDPSVRKMVKPHVAEKLLLLRDACEVAMVEEGDSGKLITIDAQKTPGRELGTYLNAQQKAKTACQLFVDATKFAEEFKLK